MASIHPHISSHCSVIKEEGVCGVRAVENLVSSNTHDLFTEGLKMWSKLFGLKSTDYVETNKENLRRIYTSDTIS